MRIVVGEGSCGLAAGAGRVHAALTKLGAEVGIATGKLHARGPMGLEGLTTYKYKLIGSGQTMSGVKSGKITYTHRPLHEDCPL